MKTLKIKNVLSVIALGGILFISSSLFAKETGDANGFKAIQKKVEKQLKLPENLKSEIKSQSVEIYFTVDEFGNVKSVLTQGENQILNYYAQVQFSTLNFPELERNKEYRINLKYKTL